MLLIGLTIGVLSSEASADNGRDTDVEEKNSEVFRIFPSLDDYGLFRASKERLVENRLRVQSILENLNISMKRYFIVERSFPDYHFFAFVASETEQGAFFADGFMLAYMSQERFWNLIVGFSLKSIESDRFEPSDSNFWSLKFSDGEPGHEAILRRPVGLVPASTSYGFVTGEVSQSLFFSYTYAAAFDTFLCQVVKVRALKGLEWYEDVHELTLE